MGAKKAFRYRTFPIYWKVKQVETIKRNWLCGLFDGCFRVTSLLQRQLLYRRKVMLFATDFAIVFGGHFEKLQAAVGSEKTTLIE